MEEGPFSSALRLLSLGTDNIFCTICPDHLWDSHYFSGSSSRQYYLEIFFFSRKWRYLNKICTQCPMINFMSENNYGIRSIVDIISFGGIFSISTRRRTQWYNHVFTCKITRIIKKSKPRKQNFAWNAIIWSIYFYEIWCCWPHSQMGMY